MLHTKHAPNPLIGAYHTTVAAFTSHLQYTARIDHTVISQRPAYSRPRRPRCLATPLPCSMPVGMSSAFHTSATSASTSDVLSQHAAVPDADHQRLAMYEQSGPVGRPSDKAHPQLRTPISAHRLPAAAMCRRDPPSPCPPQLRGFLRLHLSRHWQEAGWPGLDP